MKVGDQLTVSVEGVPVTTCIITEKDYDSITVQIPGTEAVIGLSHSLTDEKPEYVPEVDRVLLDETESTPTPPPAPVAQEIQEPARSLREMNLDSSAIDKD